MFRYKVRRLIQLEMEVMKTHNNCNRCLVMNVKNTPNPVVIFSIEDRWPEGHEYSKIMADSRFDGRYIDSDTSLLIQCLENAGEDVSEKLFWKIFSKLVLMPEVNDYLDNHNHAPGFIETWLHSAFMDYVELVMKDREREVEKIMNS